MQGESYCAGHLGLGVAAGGDVARAAQRQGAERRSEELRRARRTPEEAQRELLVENAEQIARAKLDLALDPKAAASDRLAAIRSLEDRVLGKPKETTVVEVDMPDDFEALRQMSIPALATLYRQLGGDGALAQLLPGDSDAAVVLGYEDEPLPDGQEQDTD